MLHEQVRAVVNAITTKIQSSCLEMNAQELGNALYGLQDMTSDYPEVHFNTHLSVYLSAHPPSLCLSPPVA